MKTKQEILLALNDNDAPRAFGFSLAADDGRGNQYWTRERGATVVRLNRYEDMDSGEYEWTGDVTGWENV